ncbi:hypothetical protein D3C87_1425410 [compost metagenome]
MLLSVKLSFSAPAGASDALPCCTVTCGAAVVLSGMAGCGRGRPGSAADGNCGRTLCAMTGPAASARAVVARPICKEMGVRQRTTGRQIRDRRRMGGSDGDLLHLEWIDAI